MKIILIALIALTSTILFAKNNIVKGEDVEKGSLIETTTVSLLIKYQERLVSGCTGTALNEHLVITAAHCINGLIKPELYISNGDNPLVNPFRYKVSKLKYYRPMFWDQMEDVEDIAILITEKPMKSFTFAKISIPTKLNLSNQLIQAGYGYQSFTPSTEVPTYPDYGKLQMLNSGIFESLDKQILVIGNYNSSGVMGGDSGGPLYSDDKENLLLLGVLSQGGENGSGGQHATYTVPYFFIDWMNCSLPDNVEISGYGQLDNQFPCDNQEMVPLEDFPEYNKSRCEAFREGWSINDKLPTCFPRTRASCEKLSAEVGNELYWNTTLNECSVKS